MTAAQDLYTTALTAPLYAMHGSLQSQVQALTGSADAGLDALIVAAFDGTGAFEAAATAGADACPARKEFIVKSIQNNLFSKMTIGFAATNVAQATWIFTGPTTRSEAEGRLVVVKRVLYLIVQDRLVVSHLVIGGQAFLVEEGVQRLDVFFGVALSTQL